MTLHLTTHDLTIAILPGGPGLSGATLQSLQALGDQTKVFVIEPSGNGTDWSYDALLAHVVHELRDMSNIVLCGHSFGGLLASEAACGGELDVKGLVVMGTPFSSTARESIRKQYAFNMTPELSSAGEEFSTRPSNETFRKWLSLYRNLYFSSQFVEAGSEMLASDKAEYRAYLGAATAGSRKEHLLALLHALQIPKLFLAGEEDKLFPCEFAEQDAISGGFEFRNIKDAGHFMAFERANEVLAEIRMFLNRVIAQQNLEGI